MTITNDRLRPRRHKNSADKQSFYLQKQSLSCEFSNQSHTGTNDYQNSSSRLFSRQSTIDNRILENTECEPLTHSSRTIANEESKKNTNKIILYKSFILGQQSAIFPQSVSKTFPQNKHQLTSKVVSRQNSTTTEGSTSSSITNPDRQVNRTVQLRRQRAKAKIEQLSRRTTKQLRERNIKTASYPNNHISNRKESRSFRSFLEEKMKSQQEDLSITRTISSSYQQQLSTSPKQFDITTLKDQETMIPNNREDKYQKVNSSVQNFQEVNKIIFNINKLIIYS